VSALFELFEPLAAQSGEVAGVPYLLQPNFPLLLVNTAFGFEPGALDRLEARFAQAGLPLAFTLPEDDPALPELAALGFSPSATFELCQAQPSKRSFWTEQVPWSEAWSLSRILTEAYGAPEWRFPFAQALGKLLRREGSSAFFAYLYGDAVGAVVTYRGVGLLAGVVPARQGHGAGTGLLGRIAPMPFLRLAGSEAEFPGEALRRFVRLGPA
jgi:hypothetical protein